jgi:hypothetical protein
LYQNLEELKADTDEWIGDYNTERPHSGKYCYGKTPKETFAKSKHLANEKELDNEKWWSHNPRNRTPTTVEDHLTVGASLD